MKKLIFIPILLFCFSTFGQNQTQPTEKNDTLIVTHNKAEQLKQILSFSYTWLPKSDAPAKEVGIVIPLIQELYNILWPTTSVKKEDKNKAKIVGKP